MFICAIHIHLFEDCITDWKHFCDWLVVNLLRSKVFSGQTVYTSKCALSSKHMIKREDNSGFYEIQ